MAKDFVCAMDIDETKAGASYTFDGITYFFCASERSACCVPWRIYQEVA
jgi:YHS domain-containing protein